MFETAFFLHRGNITMLFFGSEKDLYCCSSVLSCIVEMHLAKYTHLYIGEIHQFVWYACTFEFMWCTQYAQDLVTKLVSLLFYQSDCCKLPCYRHCSLVDGSLFVECSAWADNLANPSCKAWTRWSSDSGLLLLNDIIFEKTHEIILNDIIAMLKTYSLSYQWMSF